MILACHGIQKSFGEHLIVRDGSFHIEDHEKAALVGPNGAGKSTLLKMIVGESAPDDGNVILTKVRHLAILPSIKRCKAVIRSTKKSAPQRPI